MKAGLVVGKKSNLGPCTNHVRGKLGLLDKMDV